MTTTCCSQLEGALADRDVPIVYNAALREWSLYVFSLADPEQPDWREHLTRQDLWFCPFCGFRFPGSVRDQYFNRLRAIGIEPMHDVVPVEYKSDVWWREAGL